jgi:cytochrome P450
MKLMVRLGYDVAKHDGSTGSVLSTIDPAEHNKRRRVWDRAFTPTALKSYQPMLQNRVAQLVTALDARSGKEIDLAEWLAYMALDFMGDFAYGGMFNFMRDGDPEGFRHMGEKFTFVGELLGSISWIKPVVLALPRATGPLLDTGVRVAKQRQAEGSSHGKKDLFYYLVSFPSRMGRR